MARRRRSSSGRKRKLPKIGTGARFRRVAASARRSGARNPNAVAAAAGRKKYGKRRFAKLAAAGRRRKSRGRKRR